jgi:protein N-lysine methyltransferase METTL21D
VQHTGGDFRGLGYIDNHKDMLTLEFVVPSTRSQDEAATISSRKKKGSKAKSNPEPKTLEVLLAQDKTALRSRKGDTGSVLWRARCVLR